MDCEIILNYHFVNGLFSDITVAEKLPIYNEFIASGEDEDTLPPVQRSIKQMEEYIFQQVTGAIKRRHPQMILKIVDTYVGLINQQYDMLPTIYMVLGAGRSSWENVIPAFLLDRTATSKPLLVVSIDLVDEWGTVVENLNYQQLRDRVCHTNIHFLHILGLSLCIDEVSDMKCLKKFLNAITLLSRGQCLTFNSTPVGSHQRVAPDAMIALTRENPRLLCIVDINHVYKNGANIATGVAPDSKHKSKPEQYAKREYEIDSRSNNGDLLSWALTENNCPDESSD